MRFSAARPSTRHQSVHARDLSPSREIQEVEEAKAVWGNVKSLWRAVARDTEILIHCHRMAGLLATHFVSRVNKAPVEFLQEGLTRQRSVAGILVSSDKRKEWK
jgi:hypothetical protein